MDTRTIGGRYVTAALAGARRQGRDPRMFLRAAGIPVGLLDDPLARVTPDQFTALVQALWVDLDDEYMGLAPVPCRRGAFAMMCHATIHCADLGAALRRGFAFYRLFPGGPRMSLEVTGDEAAVVFELHADDPDRFLAESVLVIWHRFSSWATGRRILLRQVDFTYREPAHSAEYDLLFGCPPRFEQPRTAFVFDAAALRLPILQDEGSLAVFLRDAPAGLLAGRDYGTSVAERVRRLLDRPGRRHLQSLREVAGELALSEQTVRRRLREEGTSFRRVREDVLRDVAVAALVRGDEPVEHLAERLGFSEASAFHRAFKRWTGTTPGSYRESVEATG
ncbi:MAG: AraC family transcriptional regulator [Streptosporangiales bacterium]|nr:AraC family transcriptional regulator [Streptosporangiales bacterium]MBO0889979.1 AraC family transcriptional regulator [Acidothermales bacterium]